MRDYSGTKWAETAEDIEQVASVLLHHRDLGESAGLDTEFHGVDLSHDSCVARSRIHVWSVALHALPRVIRPRGYYASGVVVLPEVALENVRIREALEDPALVKGIHNQPVDDHSMANYGITIRGAINTLDMARWMLPDRTASTGGRGFGLDELGEDLMGMGKTEGFDDIFSEEYDNPWFTTRQESRCECGTVPCHRRGAGHVRSKVPVVTRHERRSVRPIPLESVDPNHPLMPRLVPYAGRDAVIGLGVLDILSAMKVTRPIPW